MKYLRFLTVLWLFSILSYGQQIINVNSSADTESSYAPEQLVKDILIASAVVIESFPPESIATKILHPAFTSPNEVQVDVKGRGDYEYALDDGPWQKNNILKNVHYGMHTIYVRDRYGCAIEKVKINIIDYPKYFTPNGDGYHDTWNISSLRHQANAKIYIFDRYGKLLKEIRPAGEGWNGTFNGQPMPTTDYWFVVEYYTEASNILKQFKAHFTLKR